VCALRCTTVNLGIDMTNGCVLVLEDSRTQAQHISKMLEGLGWSSMLCFDHKGLLSLGATPSIDAMLLDVYIEDGNTIVHLPRLRELAPQVPVAIMSAGGIGGRDLGPTLAMARQAKADFILPKPFDAPRLKAILDNCYRIRRAKEHKKHLLVIDDSRTIRRLIRETLMTKGYRVSEAESMEEALENIDIAHVDLVIIDIFMPGMGGIEGIRLIRKAWPEVAIIAMSAGVEQKVGSAQVLAAAAHMGAVAQLPKPFSHDDLLNLVDMVLEEPPLPVMPVSGVSGGAFQAKAALG
jgi:DNA-binding NtrC family response regulator